MTTEPYFGPPDEGIPDADAGPAEPPAPQKFAPGDLVRFAQRTPTGWSERIGRVITATASRLRVEWVEVSAPISVDKVERAEVDP